MGWEADWRVWSVSQPTLPLQIFRDWPQSNSKETRVGRAMNFKLVSALFVAMVLCGCARMPPVYSDDGAAINFSKDGFEYTRPNDVTTKCRFDSQRAQALCDDGTESTMISAGLPFEGVVLVTFDGRGFSPDPKPR